MSSNAVFLISPYLDDHFFLNPPPPLFLGKEGKVGKVVTGKTSWVKGMCVSVTAAAQAVKASVEISKITASSQIVTK